MKNVPCEVFKEEYTLEERKKQGTIRLNYGPTSRFFVKPYGWGSQYVTGNTHIASLVRRTRSIGPYVANHLSEPAIIVL